MSTTDRQEYISYRAAMQAAGMSERTFYRRLAQGRIPVYAAGTDNRRRLIDVRDLPKLTEPQEIEPAREYDGSAA
jgi:hypothetical protein